MGLELCHITWFLKARLKRWGEDEKRAVAAVRDSPGGIIPEPSFPSCILTEDGTCIAQPPRAPTRSSVLLAGGRPCARAQAVSEGEAAAFWAEQHGASNLGEKLG